MSAAAQRAWCRQCRRRSEVVDTDTAYAYLPHGEVSQRVKILLCGHTVAAGPEEVVGVAPGAPFAARLRASDPPW